MDRHNFKQTSRDIIHSLNLLFGIAVLKLSKKLSESTISIITI